MTTHTAVGDVLSGRLILRPALFQVFRNRAVVRDHHDEIQWVLCSRVTELGAGDPVPSSPSPAGYLLQQQLSVGCY